MASRKPNPWLDDYDVDTAPGSHAPGEGTKAGKLGSPSAGGRATPGGRHSSVFTKRPRVQFGRRIGRVGWILVGAMALGAGQQVVGPFIHWLDGKINVSPVVTQPSSSPPAGLDLFALRVQVRINAKEGREYVRKYHPNLETAFDHVNSNHGLHIHPGITRKLPAFILEPRPGREDEFKDMEFHGLGGITLHAFPYESEDQLYRIAGQCGLNTSQGSSWVKTWSTWREGDEKFETNKCVPGGVCVLISRGCETDTFEKSN